jgi:dGTP triphosphohydrolase
MDNAGILERLEAQMATPECRKLSADALEAALAKDQARFEVLMRSNPAIAMAANMTVLNERTEDGELKKSTLAFAYAWTRMIEDDPEFAVKAIDSILRPG